MAITRTAGAWTAGSTTVTPPLPATPQAGDLHVIYIGGKPYSITIGTLAGWTPITGTDGQNGTTASGTDVGSVRWAAFYRYWQSGDDETPTFTITSGNVVLAVAVRFRPTAGYAIDTPVGCKGFDTSSGTGYSATMDANPGITAADVLNNFTTIAGNNSTFGTPTMSATGATIGAVTENPATEGATATGNDLEASASTAVVSSGTASVAPTIGWTLSVAQTGGGAFVRIRESLAAQEITGVGNISSAAAVGSLSVGATVNGGSIASAEAFGLPTVAPAVAPQEITGVGGIATAEAHGQPAVSLSVISTGIVTAEAHGQPGIAAAIQPAGLPSGEVHGQPTIIPVVFPVGILTAEALGLPTITPIGATQEITGVGGILTAEAFGNPTVSRVAAPQPSGHGGGIYIRHRGPKVYITVPDGKKKKKTPPAVTKPKPEAPDVRKQITLRALEKIAKAGKQYQRKPSAPIDRKLLKFKINPRIAGAGGIPSQEAFGKPTITLIDGGTRYEKALEEMLLLWTA